MAKERAYIGSKIILGISMDRHTFLKTVKGAKPTDLTEENQAGYRVTYPDGYVSWSPVKAFESAYREVTAPEKALL